jgi:hypothetical protein
MASFGDIVFGVSGSDFIVSCWRMAWASCSALCCSRICCAELKRNLDAGVEGPKSCADIGARGDPCLKGDLDRDPAEMGE